MKKLKYFNTPFWSVAEAGEGVGVACWQVPSLDIMSYIYSTTPNRYTLSKHNTIAENVKFWLKTAQQREITPAPLYTGGPCGEEVRCGGGAWHRVGGWPWQTSDSGIQYPPTTPILSAYNTTKRDNSSCSVYWWVLYNWGCHIHGHVVSTFNLSQ